MTDHIQVGTEGAVTQITFARPEKKNAFTYRMYARFAEVLEQIAEDATQRVVILKGTGGDFTAGNDMGDFVEHPPVDDKSPVSHLLRALHAFRKPLVARVQGYAIGIGTTMLLHCDLVYAAPDAQFRLPFVNLGLTPEGASSYLLPRLVGHRKAAELILLAEPFGVRTAEALALVNEVVLPDELESRINDVADRLASKPAEAIQQAKRLMKSHTEEIVQRALAEEGKVFVERLRSDDLKQAVAAFFARGK